MTNDLARTLAFAFKRRGTGTMERSKLLHLLAFDLRWFSPDPAKRVIQRALQAGLLREEGDKVSLAFDADAVDIPLNFKPREDLADAESAPLDLPSRKLAALPRPPPPLDAPDPAPLANADAVAERQRRGGLVTEDVAALLVARRRGEDVRERARELEARLTSGARR